MPALEAVEWDKSRKEEFIRWIEYELHNTIGDRAELESKWRGELLQWRARVIGDGLTDVPFVGASDLELPLTAIHFDPILADFIQTLHLPPDFWSLIGKRSDTVDAAKPIQQFLSLVEQSDLQMRDVNIRVLMETIIHGTGLYKDYIHHDRRIISEYNEFGDIERRTRFSHRPRVTQIKLNNFFMPAYAWDIDPNVEGGAPWIAQRFKVRKSELRARAMMESPWLPAWDEDALERLMMWEEDEQDLIEQTIRAEDEYQTWRDLKIQLHEIWVRFDIDNDGFEEDIVVLWHDPTRMIVRTIYNPLMHGKRPYSAAKYIPGPGFYGIGLAEIDEWAQLGSTRILNSTINAAFLANASMFGVPYGANVDYDESIYPGKIWPMGPNEKIQEISMGSPDPSMFNLLDAFMGLSEKRSGGSDLRSGSIDSLPSRTPASTVMSLLQEGKKRFDFILGNLRSGPLKQIGFRTLQNLIQISKDDPRYIQRALQSLGPTDAQYIQQFLDQPVHEVEDLFGLSVTATSSQTNREAEKQSLTALGQTMAQLYQFRLQLAMQQAQVGGDPSLLLQTTAEAYQGTIELQRRMLEAFDIQNPDAFVTPKLPDQAQQPQQALQPQLPGALPQGGAPAGAGPTPFGVGSPDLLSLLGALG